MKEQLKIGGAIVVAERESDPLERRDDEPDMIGLILLVGAFLIVLTTIDVAVELMRKEACK